MVSPSWVTMSRRNRNPSKAKPTKAKRPAVKAANLNLVPQAPRTSPQPRPSGQLSRHVHAVCSITDPFCQHANGAKYFVESSSRTLTFQNHFRHSIATDAAGYASVMITPGYNVFAALGTTVGTTAYFTTYLSLAGIASPATYRIVSWGVKVRKISAPLYASGMVRVRGFAVKDGPSLAAVIPQTYNCDTSEDIPLQSCTDMCIIGRRMDYTHTKFNSPYATNPGSTVTDWVNPGWTAYLISIDGGPPTTGVFDLEFYVNYELTFDDSNSNALLCTPPLPPNPAASAAASAVYTASKGIFTQGVVSAAKWIENKAATALATYFGGPLAGRAAAMILD